MGDPNVAYARDERSVRHCPGVSGVFARWIVTPLLLASGSKLAGRASNVTANEPFARGTCANSLCGGAGSGRTIALGDALSSRAAPATGWSAFALTATSCPDRLIEA